MKKEREFNYINIIYIALFALVVIKFFSANVVVLWDSGHYLQYLDIFSGVTSWANWDLVRGIVFPLIIYLSNYFFGYTQQGFLITGFLFYIVTIAFVFLMLNSISKKNKLVTYLCLFIIVIDPIIFGFYHALLTEFVAMTISAISVYVAYYWIKIEYKPKKIISYLIPLYFVAMTCISWHLKQPYVSIALFPCMIASLLSMINSFNLKNIIYRLSTILLCIIFLVFSISAWNSFLSKRGVIINSDRNASNMLSESIIYALSDYSVIKTDSLFREDCIFVTNKDKKKYEKYKNGFYILYNKKKGDYRIIPLNDDNRITTGSSLAVITKEFFRHPLLITDSYITNYLAISNVYSKGTNDNVSYFIKKGISAEYCHELCAIGLGYNNFDLQSNVYYMREDYLEDANNYSSYMNKSIFSRIDSRVDDCSRMLFKISLLLLPFIGISSVILYFRKKSNKIVVATTLLSVYSLLHIGLHIFTGAVIDRYVMPVYIQVLICEILFFKYIYDLIFKKKK